MTRFYPMHPRFALNLRRRSAVALLTGLVALRAVAADAPTETPDTPTTTPPTTIPTLPGTSTGSSGSTSGGTASGNGSSSGGTTSGGTTTQTTSAALMALSATSPVALVTALYLRDYSAIAVKEKNAIAVSLTDGTTSAAQATVSALVGSGYRVTLKATVDNYAVLRITPRTPFRSALSEQKLATLLLASSTIQSVASVYRKDSTYVVASAGLWLKFSSSSTASEQAAAVAQLSNYSSAVNVTGSYYYVANNSRDYTGLLKAAATLLKNSAVTQATPHQISVSSN